MINTNEYISCKKVKIYPSKSQSETIDFWLRRCKTLYNTALEEKLAYYRIRGKYLNIYDQKKELVDIKDYDPTWKDVPNKSLQEIIFRIDRTFKAFFNRGNGFPKFKSEVNTMEFVKTDVRIKNNQLFLPKINSPIKYSESINPNFTSIKLTKDRKNYFLSFTYKETGEIRELNRDILGIDLGLKDLYSTSNGDKSGRFSQKLIKKYHNRISDLNKSLSKKTKKSRGFKKVKSQLSKTYARLKNTKMDYLHKKSSSLIKNIKEHYIALGDIKIQNIVDKNKTYKSKRGLVKSFYTNSLSIFKHQILYKSIRNGKCAILTDERNTSKTCSCCGKIKMDLKLSDRIYNCSCGNSIDRDVNSAINMKLLGSSILFGVPDGVVPEME